MPTIRKPRAAGRPPEGGEAKRHVVSCRVTPDVMAKLDAAIAISGRSLAQEAEARIAGHFRMEELMGGPRRIVFLAFLAEQIQKAEEEWGKDFQRDAATWTRVKLAFDNALNAVYPSALDRDAAVAQVLANDSDARIQE